MAADKSIILWWVKTQGFAPDDLSQKETSLFLPCTLWLKTQWKLSNYDPNNGLKLICLAL